VIGFAEIFPQGLAIEPPCDLLGGGDREVIAGDLDEAPALKFVLEQLALGLCTFQEGVGMAQRVGQSWIGKVVKAGWGYDRNVGSLGHGFTPLAWVRAGLEVDASPRLAFTLYVIMAKSITVKRKKPGRPATGTEPLYGVRISDELMGRIQKWGTENSASRSEAIRRLVELGLKKGR
jgi:hypothetical protein